MTTTRTDNPKVFVSYSWTSPEHEDFVLGLAERLMSDGVHVVLDKWDLKEGHDKYVFMEQMVTDASVAKVLVISDKRYTEKANNREGGVGTESQIISDEVYQKVNQEKFIPIVTQKDEDNNPYLPTILKNRIFIDLSADELFYGEYDKLLRNIYDRPALSKPKLGRPPSYITEDTPQSINTLHTFSSFKDAVAKGKITAKAMAYDFLEDFINSFEAFRITSNESLDDKVINIIEQFKPYRDQFCEFLKLTCLHFDDEALVDDLLSFLEKVLSYEFPPKDMMSCNEQWFDSYRFIGMELFIYITAVLIKHRKFILLDILIEEKYYVSKPHDRGTYSFTRFNSHLRSLDEQRNQRLGLNRISVTADLFHDRADVPGLSFDSIMEADFILCLRSIFASNNQLESWFPKTLVYKDRYHGATFELFARAESPRYFQILKQILHVDSKKELIDKLEKAYEVHGLERWTFDHQRIPFKLYMNIDKLCEA